MVQVAEGTSLDGAMPRTLYGYDVLDFVGEAPGRSFMPSATRYPAGVRPQARHRPQRKADTFCRATGQRI